MNGADLEIVERKPLGGGCISRTEWVRIPSGKEYCLKQHDGSGGREMLEAEAAGLRALVSSRGPRVPSVEAVWTEGRTTYLLMEYVATGRPDASFEQRFGRELARLHFDRRSDSCGFDRDNFIGSTPQPNERRARWCEFFGEVRLGYQVRLARERGLADSEMAGQIESLAGTLNELLFEPDQPSLLHGDLWGGNYLCDREGKGVLIDPAVYYGHREADLAMTELFGGFGRKFYEAYRNEWPLDPGYTERRDIYNLYHLLNHLNIFGSGYAGAVRRICRRYA